MKKFGEWLMNISMWSTVGCFWGVVMFMTGYVSGYLINEKEKEEE